MNQKRKKYIPFTERFQQGTIFDLEADICHLRLKDCPWAQTVRVRAEGLPAGKRFADFKKGETRVVFLLHPVLEHPGMVHGSLTWAQKENNPWHHDCPVVGTLHQAEARSYLDTRGVFVRLENGIDAFLAGQQVPGGAEDISRAVDLGDVLSVQITAVRKDVLEVDCSVRAALQTLQHQEERRRREEFSPGPDQAGFPGGLCPAQGGVDPSGRTRTG